MANSSARKARANRLNALKSTGPKTEEGKAIVRHNALKHGLLAKEVVINNGEGRESRQEFTGLLTELMVHLQPLGPLEEMLVERIAVTYWRLRRVLRYEVGAIRQNSDASTWANAKKLIDKFRHDQTFHRINPAGSDLRTTTLGTRHHITVLEEIKAAISEDQGISDYTKKTLIKELGTDDQGLAMNLLVVHHMIAHPDEDTKSLSDQGVKPLLDMIDREIAGLKDLATELENIEELDRQVDRLMTAVPVTDEHDRLMRYETTLERQFYRAIDQLERLQRSRRGDIVPPPINVDIIRES